MKTQFEHAKALLDMWSAYDRSEPDAWGCKLQRGHASTIAYVEASAVVGSHVRLAVAKGVLVQAKHTDAWGLPSKLEHTEAA